MTKRKSKRHSKGPPPSLKKINPAAAQSGLQKYPTDALVGTMNIILDIIRHRGTEILDWDDKEKRVLHFKTIAGTVYILAPKKPKPEASSHEDGENAQ